MLEMRFLTIAGPLSERQGPDEIGESSQILHKPSNLLPTITDNFSKTNPQTLKYNHSEF